jgi:hypothetical protein
VCGLAAVRWPDWANVYFWQFFENNRRSPNFWPLLSRGKSCVVILTKHDCAPFCAIFSQTHHGPIFLYIFSAENHFPRKNPRNFLEKRFFITFSSEYSIFSQRFWGKIFREIFPGKNVQKIGPWSPCLAARYYKSIWRIVPSLDNEWVCCCIIFSFKILFKVKVCPAKRWA